MITTTTTSDGEILCEPRRIYIHFLDIYHYLRASTGTKVSFRRLVAEGRLAFRLAFLFADELLIPASSFFESPLAKRILSEHDDLIRMGFVALTAGDASLDEHQDSKRKQYGVFSPPYLRRAYDRRIRTAVPPYVCTAGSSVGAISKEWIDFLEGGRLRENIERSVWIGAKSPQSIEAAWRRVPGELLGRAFVPDHARDILARMGIADPPMPLLELSIEAPYVSAYANRLRAGLVVDLVYLKSPFLTTSLLWPLSYRRMAVALATLGLLPLVRDADTQLLLAIRTPRHGRSCGSSSSVGRGTFHHCLHSPSRFRTLLCE